MTRGIISTATALMPAAARIWFDTIPAMDFDEWLSHGMSQGWCGPAVCVPHDGVPTSAEEENAYDDGDDPCVHVIRLYPDAETKAAVESAHSPSVWRATNAGLPLPTERI